MSTSHEPGTLRRWGRSRVLALVLIAPFIGEFVLGNLPPFLLPLIIVLAPMYGAGALLIREVAVRRNLSWFGVAALALAYGLVEEGLVTQSLFNPDYAGERLLDPGFVAWLGTGLPWAVFVLGLHVMGSICTPIAIAETLAGQGARRSWLRRRGLVVAAVVFGLGCVVNGAVNQAQWPYVAPWYRLLGVAALAVLVALLGSQLRRRSGEHPVRDRPTRPPLTVAVTVGLSAGLFLASVHLIDWLRPAGTVAVQLVAVILVSLLLRRWSREDGWTARHTLAAAAGVTVAYGIRALAGTDPRSPAGAGLALGTLVLVALALLLLRAADRRSDRTTCDPSRPRR